MNIDRNKDKNSSKKWKLLKNNLSNYYHERAKFQVERAAMIVEEKNEEKKVFRNEFQKYNFFFIIIETTKNEIFRKFIKFHEKE